MIRRLAAASAALIVFSELCACSHGGAVACEPTSRYSAAATDGPVRIPDDLNPPDETDSLRLPPNTGPTAQLTKPCLETPPGFYADGAPTNPRGQRGGAAAPRPRRAAPPPVASPAPPPASTTTPAPASAPAPGPDQPPPVALPAPPANDSPPVAAPAPPASDAPPQGGDREITN